MRVKANELSQRNRKTQLNQEIAWARTKKAVAGTSSLVSRRKTKAGIICEVKGDGRVVCVRLTSLLAFYNNEMGAAILQDINRLPEVFEMDPGARAVMHCGSGVWGTEDLLGDDTYASIFGENGESSEGEAAESGDAPYTSEAEGVAEPSGSISSETAKRVNDQCLKLQKKVADSMPERGTSPGFTGMTGIDSLESSICGMEITSGPGSDFTEQALKQIEIFSESCDTNVIESMMDADNGQAPCPGRPPCDDIGAPDDPSRPSGQTSTSSPPTTTTTNPDGTTTTTTTTIYPQGTWTESITTDEQGNIIETNTRVQTDAGVTETNIKYRDDDTKDYDTKIISYDEGSITRIKYTENPDGSKTNERMQILGGDDTGYYEKDADGNWVQVKGDCIGEPCTSCVNFASFMPQLIQDCLTGGGRSYSCESFANAASCCSNPDAFPGDPRLVMPRPDGDFACGESIEEADLKKGACSNKCKYASSASFQEDCNTLCMESKPGDLGISVLDTICQYAISEACFSSQGTIPTPDLGYSPPPQPPAPPIVADNILLPIVGNTIYESLSPIR
ncbi:MAG: hypothetical protein ACYSTI_11410 [Planctomycetota bacterium]